MARQLHDALESSLEKSHKNSYQFTGRNTTNQLNESIDSGDPNYPSGIKLALIFVALCLTVFLVALVCDHTVALAAMTIKVVQLAKNILRIGPNDHCYCYPDHHIRIPQH